MNQLPVAVNQGPDVWAYLRCFLKMWIALAAGAIGVLITILSSIWPSSTTFIVWAGLIVATLITLTIAPYQAWQDERRKVRSLTEQLAGRQRKADLLDSIGFLLTRGNALEDELLTGNPVRLSTEHGSMEDVLGYVRITCDVYNLPKRDYLEPSSLENLNFVQRAQLTSAGVLEDPTERVTRWVEDVRSFVRHALEPYHAALLEDQNGLPVDRIAAPELFASLVFELRCKKYRLAQFLDKLA